MAWRVCLSEGTYPAWGKATRTRCPGGLINYTVPLSYIDYLDNSLSLMPLTEFLLSNITLRAWDGQAPIYEDYAGYFDIINVHLLMFVLLEEEVSPVVSKLVKILSMSVLHPFSATTCASDS